MSDELPRKYVFNRRNEAFQLLKSMGYKKQPRLVYKKVFADGYYAQIAPSSSRAGANSIGCGIGYVPFNLATSLAAQGASVDRSSNMFWFERGDRPFSVDCFGNKDRIWYSDDLFDEFVEDAALMDAYLTANANEAGVLRMFGVKSAYSPNDYFASHYPFYLASIGRLEQASSEFKKLPGGTLQIDYEDQTVGWLPILRSQNRFLDLYFDTTFPAELDPRS
jgi:hypothetical protein